MTLPNSLTNQRETKRPFRLAAPTAGATTLRLVLMLVVNLSLLAAIAFPIMAYINPPGAHTPWYAWVMMLAWQPLMALQGIVWHRFVDKRPLAELPWRWDGGARRAALWGSLLTILLMAAFVGLTAMTGLTTWRWNSATLPITAILFTLLTASAGFGEEIMFRGYVMRTLGHLGARWAAVLSSVIFALMHTTTGRINPLDLLALFLHGYFFALLAQRTKSVWPGMIIHFLYNGLTCLVWANNLDASPLLFDGNLTVVKWVYKAAMVIPYLLMLWLLDRKQQRTQNA
ncbi:MAG TPA: type II CAAX endopeptidase family protein [Symbiobacteriaceae bacterium]|nr:type II CAAX endopeptidase family protein [Symbiobacteriaceae bacterium]